MKKTSFLALLLVIALCLPTFVGCDDLIGDAVGGVINGGGNKAPGEVTNSEKPKETTAIEVEDTNGPAETEKETVILEDTTVPEETESINPYEKFKGNWHMAVDSFKYGEAADLSDGKTIKSAITNNLVGTYLSTISTAYDSITATYVCLAGGWFAIDGCEIDSLNCKIYAADGRLLNVIGCNLRMAENGVVSHVIKNMRYSDSTVPYRIDTDYQSVIDLTAYAGQTVAVVYEADVVDYDNDLEMIRINVTVPEHADEIMIDGWMFHHENNSNKRMNLSAELTPDGLYSSAYSVDGTPFLRMTTINTVDLKQGVYMKIRVDEFDYNASDSWFDVMFWDQQYALPGSSKYGQGVQSLIRPGNNNHTQWFYEEFTQTQYQQGYENIPQDVDGQGRHYLTVELSWDEANDTFVCTINGVSAPQTIIEYMNNKWGGSKSYAYVGFCFQHNSAGETIACTLLDFSANVVYPGPDDDKPDVDKPEEETTPVAGNTFEGDWIACQDSINYASKSDYSDANTVAGSATNKNIGSVPSAIESGITARYLSFNGWLGIDGYSLEGACVKVYATDGKLLETIHLINDGEFNPGRYVVAEPPVQDHLLNSMGYAESTVGYRYYSPIIDLTGYENSTVIVACEVDLEGSDEVVNILKITVTVPEDPDVYKGNWHCSVDVLLGDIDGNMDGMMNGDFSNVDVEIMYANTNNYNGNTIINSEGSYPSITARYVYFACGWLVVDGYDIDSWSCRIYAADGTLLETVELGLNPAEQGVIDHVENNMGYGEGTVPHRVTNNAEDELIDLGKYAGQTVTLVYVAGLADSEKLVEMVEIDVIVPEAIDVPEESTATPATPEVSESEGLTFLSNGDGTCSLIGVGDCKDTEIVIPAVSPEGYSVTSIGDYAFSSCYDITSVIIPEGVTSIGNNVFQDCWNITSVVIPESVSSIGDCAFAGCFALASITIPESVTTIGYMTFSDCDSFTSITIPDSVTSIGDSAFNSCDNLTSITIPNSVTYIGVYAFNCCTNLTSITIPNNLTRIGCWAFADCTRLASAIFENTSGWEISNGTSILSTNLENYSVAATLLKSTYRAYDWTRN